MPIAPQPMKSLDWPEDKARSLGDKVMALWGEFLRKLPEMPVSEQLTPESVKRAVTFAIPEDPLSESDLLDHVRKLFFDYSIHTGHPGFLAYIMGAGTVPGAIGEFVSAALNQNVGGWRLGPGATEIEIHLLRWFAELFGLPKSAGGLVMSGGALANFTALKVARDRKEGAVIREKGLFGRCRLVLYASERAHATIDRAADMLGIGYSGLRKIKTDLDFKIQPHELAASIEHDLAAGFQPFAVVATSGTTSTGSIDPLVEVAQICQKYGLWFHVDGAYGAVSMLSEENKPLFAGIELADSITFDPHKWLYIPQSASCLLFRDKRFPEESFVIDDDYVYEDKEETGSGYDLSDFGPQWSRGFHAFKIWFSLIAHGKHAFSQRIAHDIALTEYFAKMINETPNFEIMSKPSLSICCFRYNPLDKPNLAPAEESEYLNALNKRIVTEVQMEGKVYPSSAVLNGQFVLRTCIVNFRTEACDLNVLIEIIDKIGSRLKAGQPNRELMMQGSDREEIVAADMMVRIFERTIELMLIKKGIFQPAVFSWLEAT